MTTAWAHLPNAALIDEVLASFEARPDKWVAVRGTGRSTAWNVAWGAAWSAAWGAVRNASRAAPLDAVRNATRTTAWEAARVTAWDAALEAAWEAARVTAWSTAMALIAYDDAGQFMKMPVEHLQRLYRIDPHPMYLLLQPAAAVFAED